VVLRAMARDPAARFPTLHDLARTLLPFASGRSRVTWGVVFDPGGAHGPSDTHLDATSRPPPRPGATGDTLADAAQVRDTTTLPLDRRRRSRMYLLALGATALVALATLAAVRTTRTPQAATTAREGTPPDAAMRAPVEPSAPPPSAPPVAAAVTPSGAALTPDASLTVAPTSRGPAHRAPRRRHPPHVAVPDIRP